MTAVQGGPAGVQVREAGPGPGEASGSRVVTSGQFDVRAVRRHFSFPGRGRIALNNAASTQPPRELLALYQALGPGYENVHRGQSSASAAMTARFEESYDTIARFIGAPGRASIALYRNATEAINAVMYSLLTEFRDGDNVVTTLMEHNSNYVPWHGMCREILPRFGRRVQCRLARFDPVSGELDLDHLASLIDARTKLVCCTGASNFLGTRNPLGAVRALADASGYFQPNGERRSHLLVDGAQLVPGSFVDVQALGADYLAFSFHKLLAPFGVGVLYAKEHLLSSALPFLYGGDMIAEGRVFPNHVEYNALPWKYAAGTPNILGAVISAQARRSGGGRDRRGPQRRALPASLLADRAERRKARTLLTITSCPQCHAPAEITERFTLPSTDGPVAHVAVSCPLGHRFRMAADRLPAQAPSPGLHTRLRAALLAHTFQLCVHCQDNPAGFWVSRKDSNVVHRPWCLSCCQELDQARCDVTPFGG